MLERAARELEPFLDEMAFVGGATIALWITDPGAPEPRATKDVDATKMEAWKGRGGADHLRSHDLEDVIKLIDGRVEVVDEVKDASGDLREFLAQEFVALLGQPRFIDAIDGTVAGLLRSSGRGSGEADRVKDVVVPRIKLLTHR